MPSPFKLFEPYGSNDKDKFFGRDDETFALYNLLQQTRLVLVYGASGTGKTSVINAGLPKVFKLTDWYRVSVRRKDNINKSFRDELARLTEQTSVPDINAGIQQLYEKRWIPIYLVFDQFEELFTLGNDEERKQFFTEVQTLLDKNLPCKIILSMREEYIGHLYEYEPLLPTLFDKRFRVEPMKDATVKEVINQMCAGEVELENGKETLEQILEQVKEGKQAVHLPYLQVYLHYLYKKSSQKQNNIIFTKDSIDSVGKLGNVLKDYIETQLEAAKQFFTNRGLPEDFARRLLDKFSTIEGTKQCCKTNELARMLQIDIVKIKQGLIYFTDCKMLRADENDVERYEPVHDVVAKQIHELRTEDDKEFKTFVRQLQIAHDNWQRDYKNNLRLLNQLDLKKLTFFKQQLIELPDFEIKLSEFVDQSIHFVSFKENEEKRIEKLLSDSKSNTKAVLDKIYFYNDEFGLAFDKVFRSYGFIDKELNTKIEFKYQEALPFEFPGFAKVKRDGVYYLINTEGIEYKLVNEINKLDKSVLALDLREKNYEKIPDEVFHNTQIKILLLSDNKITILPPEVGNLTNLLVLMLAVNQLTTLPKEISKLTSLSVLNLGANKIQVLPLEIGKLLNLTSLNLTFNQLILIPKEIGNLYNLTSLRLGQNFLKTLPKHIVKLDNLADLELDRNHLNKLPKGIGTFSKIKSLSLGNNPINHLPLEIFKLISLKSLGLGNIKLTFLNKKIGKLFNLTNLSLSNNNITTLPKEIDKLTQLTYLDIFSANLTTLPTGIKNLINLEEFFLIGNPILEPEKEKIKKLLPHCKIYF